MRPRIILIALLNFYVIITVAILALGYYWTNYKAPKIEPEQPIKFPHDIHAGKLNLDCKFCHKYVDRAIYASIPSKKVCMTCHQTAATDRPEVQKLIQFWKNEEPIPWVIIHKLPDHVYFSHKRHVRAGVDCAVCHGTVRVMKTVRQVRSLKMGFCITCHKANSAPRDCWTCHK